MATGRSSQTSTKDRLLYFLIAPLMIAAFMGAYFYAQSKGIDEYTIVKWMNICITAAFVFGFSVKEFWRFHKKRTFWVELTVLLIAHFALLSRLHWEKAGYFWLVIVVGVPELFVVFILLGVMFKRNQSSSAQDSSPLQS